MVEAGDFSTAEEVAVTLRFPQSTVYKACSGQDAAWI
jgi:hypothetical protein